MKKMALLAVIATLVAGCKNGSGAAQSQAQTENAVRGAIQDHLARQGNLNLQAFDTNVKQVTIQGDHAKAEVEFRIKGGPGAMQLTYSLEKRDGAWLVTDSDVGSNFSHPGSNGDQGGSSTVPGANHSLGDTLRSFGAGAPPATR